jgi:hypothetical protein
VTVPGLTVETVGNTQAQNPRYPCTTQVDVFVSTTVLS